MRTLRSSVLFAIVLLTGACGEDNTPPPITAADYEGFWLYASITIPTATGPVTLTRDGTPQSIRGEARFTPIDDASGTLAARQVVLSDGLIAGEVQTVELTVGIELDLWVVNAPDGVTVFTAALAGDHLVLTLDPTDPRNTATDPPTSIVVDRVTPWTTTVVGTWDLVSITSPSLGTIQPDTCLEVDPGVTWGSIDMSVAFDAQLVFDRVMTRRLYSDATCTTVTGDQASTQHGFVEEEAGSVLRMWGVENAEAEYQAFTMSVAGTVATLARTDCLPQPGCEDEAPTEVVFQRR